MIKKTIKNDLDKISDVTGSVFTGVDNEVDRWLDPYVTGYAFIYWVSLPEWFEKDEDLKNFKRLSQINFRGFSGIDGLDLNMGTVNTGFANHEMNVVTGITRQNNDFTLTHKEYSGGVMTRMYQKWVSMIRDPRTGIAIYPKLYNCEYGARNHSGQLLYIVTRPDVTNTDKNIVEFAAFYSNVVPINVPFDALYNFEAGSQDSPTIDINFRGFPEIGPNVTEFAKKILAEKIMKKDGDAYLPFVDSYNTTDDAKNVNWGTKDNPLSQIYLDTEE